MTFPGLATLRYLEDLKRLNPYEQSADQIKSLSSASAESTTLSDLLSLTEDPQQSEQQWLASIKHQPLTYAPQKGSESIRLKLIECYTRVGAPKTVESVLLFNGAQEAIFSVMGALLSPGDEVIQCVPGYLPLLNSPVAHGAKSVQVPLVLNEQGKWSYDWTRVEQSITDKTKLITVNQPHNPTGAVLSNSDIAFLYQLVERYDLYLLSDEVALLSDFNAVGFRSLFTDHPRVMTVGVCSKSLGLSGMRVGWLFANDQLLLQRLLEIKSYLGICISRVDEHFISLALNVAKPLLERNNRIIADNVSRFQEDVVNAAEGLSWIPPQAGPVALVAVDDPSIDCQQLVRALYQQHALLVMPSECFGVEGAHFRVGLGSVAVRDRWPLLVKMVRKMQS